MKTSKISSTPEGLLTLAKVVKTSDPMVGTTAFERHQASMATTTASEATSAEADKTASQKQSLRFSIPKSKSLVNRLIAMPTIEISQKSNRSFSKKFDQYEINVDHDFSIRLESDNVVGFLNDYPLHDETARSNLPLFVLWAVHCVAPKLYQTLVGDEFGPTKDTIRRSTKALPEPIPYDETEPAFKFEFGQVFGRNSIHPTELVHTFITGATGAGKTYGGVKPLLQSFLAYKNAAGKPMGLLVIDPKSELLKVCAETLTQAGQPNRLFRPGSGQKISMFTTSCELGLEDRYRTLSRMVQIKAHGDGMVWQEKGHRLNIDMATLDRRFQLQTGYQLWGVVRSLIEDVDHTQGSQWENIHAVCKHSLLSRGHIEWLTAVSTVLLQLCPGLHGVKSVFASYTSDPELLNQLFFRVSNAEQICLGLCAPEVVGVINTNLFPDTGGDDVSMEDLIDRGRVILYQPTSSHFGDITARLVKSRFFADALARRDMKQPVGYVADEFQRFITADRDTGEQSFMDRCRAYRVTCVVATQSLSSIEHALIQGGESSPRLAVEIIVANSPTKIIYRSIDSSTHNALKEWIPPAPEGRRHVVDIRPPAQLATGSAYYLCDGVWGMHRYEKRLDVALTSASLADVGHG
ncbi:hypothetical protein JZU46_05585 [bacterium]|nr:hypothetical protein [bacterium]